MKKHLFVTALALTVFASAALAQGVSGGLKAGLNFANQNFEEDEGLDIGARTSFHFGAYANINLGTIGIQPELLYSSVGSKAEIPIIGGDLVNRLNYLTVPVMVRVNFAKIFNVHAGPQFGFLLSAKSEFDGEEVDIKDQLKGTDLGLGIGAGVDLPMGLTAGIRYSLGLSDINDSPDDNSSVNNNVLQLSVGYRLFGK